MTLTNLYLYLILIGGTTLAVTAWLLHQARAQSGRSRELVRLNEALNFDLPDFLRQCWPILSAAGFSGINWRLNWFGTTISGEHGFVTSKVLEQHFEADEISLNISLYSASSGWERRYFSRSLAESFFLLLRMDLWIKLGSVRSTFSQAAKMTVFLQHDIKNMLQLTSLATEQLLNPVPGQDAQLLSALRRSVPALRDRAQLMLKRLNQENVISSKKQTSIATFLEQSLAAHELQAELTGDCMVEIGEPSLHSIVDNLLGNYASQARSQPAAPPQLVISITEHTNEALIEIEDKTGTPCAWPERLFEPFWSEHGKGRGIGLYQARQTAHQNGGRLLVTASPDKPLKFSLFLPQTEHL
ncbi:MAG: ATP-binding protein [Pseudohongiella sp.]|nr:ATP-binding protein [Pseudohongiella sp.]MDP2126815.1 ATP-binding protein [Pseudohongiella sp.]